MKAINLTPEAQTVLARLMLRGLGEMHQRTLRETTGLETLGVLAMRMLVGAEQVQLPVLITEAINNLEPEAGLSIQSVREGLEILYRDPPEMHTAGITFHTVQ